MPNRNFVVQYTIKAANKFSGVAAKFDRVDKKIKSNINAIKLATKKGGIELERFKKKLNSVGRGMRNFGAKATLGVTLPVALMAKSMINAASDADETKSKFNTVFRSISADANKTANDLASSFDLSRIESKKLLADTGDLLSGFGFSQKAALSMSKQVQELSADLASFTNIEGGTTRASAALTKALLGERESIKSLGIAILEEDVKKRVALLTSKGMRFASMRQAKAQATLSLAMEQSKNAIGDYARTSESAANRSRKLTARFDDLKVTIGTKLLPMALKLTNFLIKIIDKFEALSPVTQNIILGFIGFAAVIGPILLIVGSLVLLFGSLSAASAATALSIGAILGPIALGIAVFTAAWEIGSRLADKLKEFPALWSNIGMVVKALVDPFIGIIELIKTMNYGLGKLGSFLGGKVANLFGAGKAEISINEARAMFGGGEETINKNINLNQRSQTDVNLNVGLAGGLEQKGGANVSQRGRPANVGLNAAGA